MLTDVSRNATVDPGDGRHRENPNSDRQRTVAEPLVAGSIYQQVTTRLNAASSLVPSWKRVSTITLLVELRSKDTIT